MLLTKPIMSDFSKLPYEIFEKILSYTEGITVFQCRIVCKDWKQFIDENDNLWCTFSKREFKLSSEIAKRKCGKQLNWYQIYRNLKRWPDSSKCMKNLRKFYHFTALDKNHAISIENNILPLRENKGLILYDMKTLKYLPVVIPKKDCLNMSNTKQATVIQLKNGILLQKTNENNSEAIFQADKYVLTDTNLYFYHKRDIYNCDLNTKILEPKLIHTSDFDLQAIQYSHNQLYLFTTCAKIITISKENTITIKPIKIPEDWVKSIKHIILIDDKNFICYSRNLFLLETNECRHLYMEFPLVTAVFFYGEQIIMATKAGEILLYKIANQKHSSKPVFEILSVLPECKFAVHLDVYETRKGPLIVATTFHDIYLLEIVLFPEDIQEATKERSSFDLDMYKRLVKLKDRIKIM